MMPTGLRIVLFGNGGYAASVLQRLLVRGERVVACVMRAPQSHGTGAAIWRIGRSLAHRVLPSTLDPFVYRDPFHGLPTAQRIATQHHIPIHDARGLRTVEYAETLRALKPDVLFVAGFHRLIPQQVLALPMRAQVNFHPSLLPQHRGGTPNRWVIRNGERETGVTAHLLTERFDEGALIVQERFAVSPGATWGDLELRIADTMADVAARVLDMIIAGPLSCTPQQSEGATYDPPYHGAHQEIDWTLPATTVQRMCRAMRPKSGGLTTLAGRRWCLWEVDVLDGSFATGFPGTMVTSDADGCPIVACGTGAIRIISVLVHGRIRSAGAAFRSVEVYGGRVLKGHRL